MGIIRQHQFDKVVLARIGLPEEGYQDMQELLGGIEAFIATLGVTYRIIELCAVEIGFAGHKAYDLEAWFPYEQKWREIATVTWCCDFQARRMRAQVLRHGKKKRCALKWYRVGGGPCTRRPGRAMGGGGRRALLIGACVPTGYGRHAILS